MEVYLDGLLRATTKKGQLFWQKVHPRHNHGYAYAFSKTSNLSGELVVVLASSNGVVLFYFRRKELLQRMDIVLGYGRKQSLVSLITERGYSWGRIS